jgi:hypothetical protein
VRSLADNYEATHSSNHETTADLVFCALVVLLLFVLALAVEVSQRVRGELAAEAPVPVEEVAKVETLSPEEIKALSTKLQAQQQEIAALRSQMRSSKQKVDDQLAALAGEQRFTGAREPAAFSMAYDYRDELYYFAPAKDVEHADTQVSGENIFEHRVRQRMELADIALRLRASRGYTEDEVVKLYSSLNKYQQIVEDDAEFVLESTNMGLYYHTLLSCYVVGDTESEDYHEVLVTNAILAMGAVSGNSSDLMYPEWRCKVDTSARRITINDVSLAPRDLRDILLSVSGRGVLLDFVGYSGSPPSWLYDEALMPAGYVSKTPKLPTR